MRKIFLLAMVLALCVALACPVFAETFVPSIGYKDSPDVENATADGENVTPCIVVSSIKDAEEQTTDIFQEDRDLLLEVYDQLTDGTMHLPLDGDYVIRDLVDVSFRKDDCVMPDHGHKEWLEQEDTILTVDFDLGIKEDVPVKVLVYIDGEWVPAQRVVNNGDGSVTCDFEDICPVVFCVDAKDAGDPPKTGDPMAQNLYLWLALMLGSLVAIVVLLANRRKFLR